MDNTQKIIAALLILAIIFSVFSLLIGFGALDFELPERTSPPDNSDRGGQGNIGLVIEESPSQQEGTDG